MIMRRWRPAMGSLVFTLMLFQGMRCYAGVSDSPESFFEGLKRGTYVRVELHNGTSVQGRFSNYDDYYGSIWIVPDKDEGTLFRSKSIRLSSIRHAEMAQQEAPTTMADAMPSAQIEFLTPP